MIEPLESRIAPATIVSTTTLTFQDVDGDDVTVKFTKPLLDPADLSTATDLFFFDTGGVTQSNSARQQLQFVNLGSSVQPDPRTGLGISILAARNLTQGGDGLVNVGAIRAEFDLAVVVVDGDLAGFSGGTPGNAESVIGVKGLTVQSMGEFGVSTQPGGEALTGNIRGAISSLTVKGDIRGVSFGATGNIGTAKIGGSIIGAADPDSGSLTATAIKTLSVGGDVVAGSAAGAGRIAADSIGSLIIKGSVYGGAVANTGVVDFGNSLTGTIKVVGDVRGGSFAATGTLIGIAAKTISVGGSLIGGGGAESGKIEVESAGAISITHDVTGAGGVKSGRIHATSADGIKTVTIGGSVIGGSVADSGTISTAGELGALKVLGDLRSGAGARSGSVASSVGIGSLTVNGSVIGTAASNLFITAAGDATHAAMGKITVLGRVEFSQILAGYSDPTKLAFANAQIGVVTIGRDWIASDLVASVDAGTGGKFGDANDVGNVNSTARISSIVIKGQALGTVGGSDGYGFVAPQIGSFKIGGTAFPLTAGTDDALAVDRRFIVGATGDLRVHEVKIT